MLNVPRIRLQDEGCSFRRMCLGLEMFGADRFPRHQKGPCSMNFNPIILLAASVKYHGDTVINIHSHLSPTCLGVFDVAGSHSQLH